MVRKNVVAKSKPKPSAANAELLRLKGKFQKADAERKAQREEIKFLQERIERLEVMARVSLGQEQVDGILYKELYEKAVYALIRHERVVFTPEEIREIEAAPVTFEELFKRLDRHEAAAG